ncbi:MAG: excinuclease ABC subunit UvrC [Phormidium sp. BM_Day4_Bin.17]|nr:excinuclease ABC subunit UvrC [Phormidium sp. BM_Day4_Bin.17]
MTVTRPLPLLDSRDRLEQRLKEIPPEPGVYLMRDEGDRILYIGKSKTLRSRVRSYFRESQPLSHRIALMVAQVCDIEFIVTDSEAEALALEANLIKQHQPQFNVLLKDDKKYPYLCITWSEDYPRIFITRKRRIAHPKDRYYGPYVDTRQLRSTLNLVKRIFPLRQRPKPLFKDRPCLNYDIGRCPGVCQELISPEAYHQTVEKVAMVFQGRIGELESILKQQMQAAAAQLDFEKAAQLRDRLQGLQSLGVDQKVALPDDRISRDAIALRVGERHACIQLFQIRAGKLIGRLGFIANADDPGSILQRVLEDHYRRLDPVEIPSTILLQHPLPEAEFLETWLSQTRGRHVSLEVPQRQQKAELIAMVERNAGYELARLERGDRRNQEALQDLAQLLGRTTPPRRLECYDISHSQGANAVASRVVFLDGHPAKQEYRHYKIRNPEITSGHSDDFASLAEVLQRRFRDYESPQTLIDSPDYPDLVVIDGGKGQLSAVMRILEEMGLDGVLSVVSLAKQREEIFTPGVSQPLETHPEQPGVQLLRRLRDESHRFAISFHRQQRSKRMRRSRLDEIPGLGFQRQQQLLAHFHSLDYVMQASPEQLAEVPGIGKRLAAEIYGYFRGG